VPRVWGAWAGPAASGARYRLGFDYTLSGTTVKVDRYVAESEYSISKSVTLTRIGALTGSYTVTFSTSGGVVDLGRGGSVTGSRGGTVRIAGRLTNVLHGLEPSVNEYISIPALKPSRVSPAPTLSSIAATAATASWTAPSSNGAAIDNYRVQWSTSSTFSSGVSFEDVGTSRSYRMTGLAANTTYYVRARARNSVDWGDWSSARSFTTLPQAPNAPSTPSVTRNSDTSHSLSWSRNPTSARPYTSQVIQRRTWTDGSWGDWASIATLSATSTSWTDTSTVANRVYRWRVVARNSAGNGYSNESVWAFTTPATPTAITTQKLASGDIRVNFTPGTPLVSANHELQHSTNGGSTWSSLTTTLPAGTTTYTHSSPDPGVTHTYRVRTRVVSTGNLGNGLNSGFRQSATVQLAAPPSTPIVLGPSSAQDPALPITLLWQHVPVDSSDQVKYQLRWRAAGEVTWQEQSQETSEDQQYTIPEGTLDSGITFEWQVRTWGVHADPSPWSATAAFAVTSPPSATITTPEDQGTWTQPQVVVEWEYFDPEDAPQAGWQMRLLDPDENVVETRSGSGDATTDTFTTLVPDATEWQVQLRLRDGAGMWSDWTLSTFSVDYPEPMVPLLGALWRPEQGAVELAITNPDPEDDEPEVESNELYRSTDGGATWELVGQGLPPNATVLDYEAPAAGTVHYRVVSLSALPSMSESEAVELVVPRTAMSMGYLSAGPGYATVASALYDLRVTDSGGLIRVQQRHDGRPDPVEYSGVARTRVLQVSFVVLPAEDDPEASLLEDWLALRDLRGPHLWRDPEGRHVYGTISEPDFTPLAMGAYEVSFTLTQTGRR